MRKVFKENKYRCRKSDKVPSFDNDHIVFWKLDQSYIKSANNDHEPVWIKSPQKDVNTLPTF